MKKNNLNKYFLFFAICLFFPVYGLAQEEPKAKKEVEIPSSIREELHRYMGYEELLPKYVSLPYDLTMNTNVRGAFLDLGFLFLLFLPILFLLGIKNKWTKLIFGFLMLLSLIMSSSNSYSNFHSISREDVSRNLQSELDATSIAQEPLSYLKLKATEVNHSIYQVLDLHIIQVFSGEGDAITYTIFFLLFIGVFLMLSQRLNHTPKGEQALVYLGLLYCFLWLILGAGVPWYGILMLALGLIFMAVGFLGGENKSSLFKYIRYGFLGISALWLMMSYSFRMANYQPGIENGRAGAIHIVPLFYGLGKKNKQEALDELFMAYRPVIDEINRNPDALIYRAGTYFQYFIDRNNERVTHDNQLILFENLFKQISDKEILAKALKKAGYHYLLLDINLALIDQTPEKSLIEKTKNLNNFLLNNPALEPIGTDRIIQLPNGQFTYGFSGGELKNIGSFIAFKIR